jgi:hypothetical protein
VTHASLVTVAAERDGDKSRTRVVITNCHVHTFTERHVPANFVRFPLNKLLRVRWIRRLVLAFILRFDRGRRGRIARFARVLEVSEGSQQAILDKVRGFYPRDTKFVVLPMDMAFMGAGEVKSSLDAQHDELAELAQSADANVIPFVAVDPRRPGVVNSTIERLENGFRGIKLWAVQGIPHPGARGGGANLPRSKD